MSPRTTALRPHKRKGFWYLARRVPKAYRAYDNRGVVFLSSGIRIVDDPLAHAARPVIAKLDAGLFTAWRDLQAGLNPDHRQQHDAVIQTAQEIGIAYAFADDVAKLPRKDLIQRAKLLGNPTGQTDHMISTVLGGVSAPELKLSQLRTEHEAIIATSLQQKSPRQLKRWRTVRDTAVDSFIAVLGTDKPIHSLSREDALRLRTFWQRRVLEGEIAIDTANKGLSRIANMLRTVNDTKMLGLPAIFDKTVIRGGKVKQRIPYMPEFVQKRILADGEFDELNPEARRVIYLVTETGLRLSEACNLNSSTIILDAPVPHIRVRPDGREMKTDQSQRDIPLVGVALMAMRKQPDGFPRYHDKADHLSALVNKVLETHNLRPNGESLYSLRHTFKDRLRAVAAPDELKDYLMGHKREQPAYGFGYSLESKADWLNRIAFRAPSSV